MSPSQSVLDSIPTFFRQINDQLSDQHPRVHSKLVEDFSDIQRTIKDDPLPVIDLQSIDPEKLSEACKEWGAFRLVNHGIPVAFLSELKERALEIFRLEFESKKKLFSSIPKSSLSYFWATANVTPDGTVLPVPVPAKDKGDSVDSSASKGDGDTDSAVMEFFWVEGFSTFIRELPRLQVCQHPLFDSLRVLLDEYGKHLARIASSVFEEITRTLNINLSQEEKEGYLSPPNAEYRVYRYLPCGENRQEAWGLGAHTDNSLITFVNQDDVGGLELFHEKENIWIDVKPIPNTLLVHVGDFMQAVSDDKYKSVKHRVKANNEKERFSIAYFVLPADDYVIRSSAYKPFTCPEYKANNMRDYKSLGYKLGLGRYKVDEAP